jgi:ribosomal protein S11
MTSRIVVNVSTGVTDVVPYTPEEESAHAAAVAAQQAETQEREEQFEALKLSLKNRGVRKQAQIDRLERQLYEEVDSNNLNALRTQAKINQLKAEV